MREDERQVTGRRRRRRSGVVRRGEVWCGETRGGGARKRRG